MIAIIPPPLDEYCAAHTTPPEALLEELASYTQAHCQYPQMVTGPVEGAFLRMLVKISGARRVIEIGTFTGYSALSMAAGLPDDGELITCDVDEETTAIAKSFWARSPHGHKIESRLGPALQTIEELPTKTVFDFVFIDADKESYVNYYEALFPRLRPGGLVAVDNVLWSGKVLDPQDKTDYALVEFNTHIASDRRVDCVMLSVRDGVSLIRKR